MATQKGIVKRTALSMYSRPRKGGSYAIEIRENDELIQAKISDGDQEIILATYKGKSIRFSKIDDRAIFLLASTATVQVGTATILVGAPHS